MRRVPGKRKGGMVTMGFNPLFIGSKDATYPPALLPRWLRQRFQSPFHRVKGCDPSAETKIWNRGDVSIPFSSGQRMRRVMEVAAELESLCFNPLFIGSKDATPEGPSGRGGMPPVSIPFSSGQRMRRPSVETRIRKRDPRFQSPFHRVKGCDAAHAGGMRRLLRRPFQSPFHRVKGCDEGVMVMDLEALTSFNPLFIGSKDATR